MRTRAVVFLIAAFCSLGCKKDDKKGTALTQASASAAAPAIAASEPAETPPGPCKAAGEHSVELATVAGDVHGFGSDANYLYYTSWSTYGGRGDLAMVRKDGGGRTNIDSLQLEPRALAPDQGKVFYTSGIRLMVNPNTAASDSRMVAEVFSSQDIAIHGDDIYGVPGDYGPYDRVAKIAKKGGDVEELVNGTRHARPEGPNGFNAIAIDDGGVYVTDSSGDRVLKLPLPKGRAATLANGQERAYALALAGDNVFFTLARKGFLMMVPKAGGTAKKIAPGLVALTPIAADESAVYAAMAGANEDAPQSIAKIAPDTGTVTPVSSVPASDLISAIEIDKQCVYWAQRMNASKTVLYAIARR